jgi:hypothetical protein
LLTQAQHDLAEVPIRVLGGDQVRLRAPDKDRPCRSWPVPGHLEDSDIGRDYVGHRDLHLGSCRRLGRLELCHRTSPVEHMFYTLR